MTLFSQLVDFYQDIGFPMTHAEGTTILSARYQGKNALWTFIASSDEDNRILIMFARAPEPCPPERMAEMSAFLERSNFGMTHGAWVMDRDDGEIRFRVGVDLQHLQLYDDYIRSLTLYTNGTMDHYVNGLQAIIKDQKSAKEAFRMVFPNG